jgi:hypothetical protein
MFDIVQDVQKDDVVAVKISGKISKEDYERLSPMIEQKIEQHGDVKMFFEMDNVEEIDYSAIWEELKFDGKNSGRVSKVAIVGERAQENLLSKIKNMLTSGETKFFKREDRDAALKWVQ